MRSGLIRQSGGNSLMLLGMLGISFGQTAGYALGISAAPEGDGRESRMGGGYGA